MKLVAVSVIACLLGSVFHVAAQPLQAPHSITAIAFDHFGGMAVAFGVSNEDPCGNIYEVVVDTFIIVNDENGQKIAEIPTGCSVGAVDFSSDDAFVYYSSYSGHSGVWDLSAENYETRSYTGGSPILGVHWSEQEAYIEFAPGFLRVWGTPVSQELFFLARDLHTNHFVDAQIDTLGERIVSAGDDGLAKVWDALDAEIIATFDEHASPITVVAWGDSNAKVASGDLSGVISVWSASSGETLRTFSSHTDKINELVWSPDGTRVASASEDGTVKVWNAQTGALIETLTYPGPVYALDWSPDGEQIA